MSLTYDLSKTSLLRTNDADGKVRIHFTRATERIIFYTMSVGIGDLSAKNAPEFWARVRLLEMLTNVPIEYRTTAADIAQHVGLATNVFPMETRTQWTKRIVIGDLNRFARGYTRDVESSTAAPVLTEADKS